MMEAWRAAAVGEPVRTASKESDALLDELASVVMRRRALDFVAAKVNTTHVTGHLVPAHVQARSCRDDSRQVNRSPATTAG